MRKLGINKDDHVLAITSAGDNVLHYALAAQCERIHAVGMSIDVFSILSDVDTDRHESLSGSHP